MKRRVIQLVMLLVAGAIVNVAVAWGCALLAGKQVPLPDSIWVIKVPDPITDPGDPQSRVSYHTTGWTLETLERSYESTEVVNWNRSGPYRQAYRIFTGWPSRSLGYPLINIPKSKCSVRGGIETGLSLIATNLAQSQFQRNLPLLPIWPGFAINTIFYAAILWVLFAVPLALRRRRRMQRGLCPACAYPVGTSPVCTECGKAVKPRMDTNKHG